MKRFFLILLIISLTACSVEKKTQKTKDSKGELYNVVRVVDGDTIDIAIGDSVERVRLLAIDTPESVKPNTEVECYSVEAADRLRELIEDKKVELESDLGQTDRDKYGRLLRYVYLEDGTFVNKVMVAEGFADRFYCHPRCEKEDILKEALDFAKENSLGMWDEDNCEYR
jgi:micrococcal nuclease